MQKQTKPKPLGASVAKLVLVVVIIVCLGAVAGILGYALTKQKPALQNPPIAQKADETVDWKTYRNEEYGFEFKYPGIYDEKGKYKSCRLWEGSLENVNPLLFISVASRVWLQILDPEGLTFSEYVDKIIKDVELESRKTTSVGGKEAVSLTFRELSSRAYGLMDLFEKDGKIYMFSLTKPVSECFEIENISVFTVYGKMLSTFKFIEKDDKDVFENMSAFPEQKADHTYMILAENNKEIVVDEADMWNEKLLNISSYAKFSHPKFSPKGNYLTYNASGYEWSNVRLYDIKNEKKKINFFAADTYGFTPDETYFYVCAASEFGGERYAKIYNVPDFTVRYDLFEGDRNSDPFGFNCEYNEVKKVLVFTFPSSDSDKGSKVIEYSFDTNKAEIK